MPSASRTLDRKHLTFDKIKSVVKGRVSSVRKARGFTLIELLVVISIIGILIATATVSYSKAQQKGRDARRKMDLKAIQQALDQYLGANGRYPPYDQSTSNEYIWWCARISSTVNPTEQLVRQALEPTYVQKVPQDPVFAGQTGDYVYQKLSRTQYELLARIENTADPERSTYNYGSCTGWIDYQYRITNP